MSRGIGPVVAVAAASLWAAVGLAGGCETSAQTGALGGAGIGALAGQVIGGSTKATLIGAAAGAGIGYVIGNEKDKQEARTMSAATRELNYTHAQTGPFAGTRWKLVKIDPADKVPPYTSKVIEFRDFGRVVTTTTNPDGRVDVADESYRVVGDTLIVNKPGYLINAKYRIEGNTLYVDALDFHAVLQRL